jgi:hypothetical protein
MSRHERLRILDILGAIDRIGSYIEGMSYESCLADRKTQDAFTALQIPAATGRASCLFALPAGIPERDERDPRGRQVISKPSVSP